MKTTFVNFSSLVSWGFAMFAVFPWTHLEDFWPVAIPGNFLLVDLLTQHPRPPPPQELLESPTVRRLSNNFRGGGPPPQSCWKVHFCLGSVILSPRG